MRGEKTIPNIPTSLLKRVLFPNISEIQNFTKKIIFEK